MRTVPKVYCLRVVLRAKRAVYLFAHHAATLYALVAESYACEVGGSPVVPDGLMLDVPEQCRRFVAKGDRYAFGFTWLESASAADGDGADRIAGLIEGLKKVGRKATVKDAAWGGNFEIDAVHDLVADEPYRRHVPPLAIGREHFDKELAAVRDCRRLTLQFGSPLRFSAYRIIELGEHPLVCGRARGLAELAFSDAELDRQATAEELAPGELRQAAAAALEELHSPAPPIRLSIPRSDGTPRELAIPRPIDRALQRAVLEVIAPGLDGFFEESSLAYRRGLGRRRAARAIHEAFRACHRWAIRADFYRFFDSIPHDELAVRLAAYLADLPLVRLILRWVKSASPEPARGLPTGWRA